MHYDLPHHLHEQSIKEEVRQEKTQDNQVRELKFNFIINEFNDIVDYLTSDHHILQKEEKFRLRRKALMTADKIVTLYNLNLDPIEIASLDSAVILYPVEDQDAYLKMLQLLFNVLKRFPYSFMMALGLKTIRVCEHVEVS
mmetsp:Transcript_21331/g.18474  ORF Transcript_21331/g.18474 Transcript_21331/m.18474 type:complete len:141 (-) Transcript_21331:564-986(-)|eukprot:CAMPEP_0114591478 /NCGR_PEP_ID=MMETSP0125-20121206/13517_1 /TAXON_ID=485358 ORGANISM="Aristerostoma sp., Strain ATCC 50986" /NCGR_SAMPLE_ID=MMETSP0125 /ASSEMBLY_ACC=CAM_ASM_000245 /LENGTH=140 /DNA_ID=CAMNT_0001789587 /DNA_START=211 /DNA_END=633 /DNA_ORIENTATION=-